MPTVSVNIPEKMKSELEKLSKEGMYQNSSEYIRDALREKIADDNGLTAEEERIVAERMKSIEEKEGKTVEELSEELGLNR
jgi:Arc/MetJ-type ribon-helix-helix transcriptional regulator